MNKDVKRPFSVRRVSFKFYPMSKSLIYGVFFKTNFYYRLIKNKTST
jgi:hypothetical protein